MWAGFLEGWKLSWILNFACKFSENEREVVFTRNNFPADTNALQLGEIYKVILQD
jgi:hypothetical protein